jgi:hypothetical protein
MGNRERPDGSIATGIGWVLVVLGLGIGFFGMRAGTSEGLFTAFAFANLGIGLGVLLLSLGYLVRAIWFLPGREIPGGAAPDSLAKPTFCQWCDRDMFPYNACSSATEEINLGRAPRLSDEICISEFRARGLMAEQSEQ